jgi:thiol-disulfide isomerase/thioredoxin
VLATVVVLAWWLLSACTATHTQTPAVPDETPPASPFAACPAVSAASSSGSLPAVTLACFTGGQEVDLRSLVASTGKPAVVNLWASWCGPCRGELPAFQAFADEMGDKVLVLGVDTADGWSAGAWAGIGFGVHYPNLYDPDGALQKALGRNALPVSLFVAADGTVRATDVSGTLTLDKLHALAAANLGLPA